MGFSSMDDLLRKITAGQFWRQDFQRLTPDGATGVVGGWWDSFIGNGNTPISGGEYAGMGNICKNPFWESLCDWNAGADWYAWDAPADYTYLRHPLGVTSSISQTVPLIPSVTYNVIFSVYASSGSGVITFNLGGTTTTVDISVAVKQFTIVAGASHSNVVITVPSTAQVDLASYIGIFSDKNFTPMFDYSPGGFPHGGNVAPMTKHIINAGIASGAATLAPATYMLVDVLGCYPNIDLSNNTTLQVLTNVGATVPRYPGGDGVQIYLVNHYATTMYPSVGIFATDNLGRSVFTPPSSNSYSGTSVCTGATNGPGRIINQDTTYAGGGTAPFMGLPGPPATGFRSLQGFQNFGQASGNSGYVAAVLCKPLLTISTGAGQTLVEKSFIGQGTFMPRVYDGACLNWIYCTVSATPGMTPFHGYLDFVWG